MPKKWGIGIEHEFFIAEEIESENNMRFNTVNRAGSYGGTARGGDDSTPVFTSRGRLISANLRGANEKVLVEVTRDGSVPYGYELITRQWQNTTVEAKVKDLIGAEKKMLAKITNSAATKRLSIFPFGTVLDRSSSTGFGSYHITFSLPFTPRREATIGEQTKHEVKTRNFNKNVQWLEPLVLAMTGGADPTSIGDSGKNSEGSTRTTRGDYGNAGGVDPILVGGQDFEPSNARYSGDTPKWRRKANLFNPRRSSDKADFRSRGIGPDGGRAIEIRFMDSFGAHGLKDLVKLFVYTANQSNDTIAERGSVAREKDSWNDAMARVMEEGWNAYLPEDYVKDLKDVLDLDSIELDSHGHVKGSLRASDIMEKVEKELWEKNKNGEISKLMIKNNDERLRLHNFNRDSWNFFFRKNMREDMDHRKGLYKFIEMVNGGNLRASNGWINVGTNTKPGVRNLVHNEMSKDFSAEDTTDIIDFLEVQGLIEVKRFDNGHPQAIKLLYRDDELRKKVVKSLYTKKYFDSDVGLDPVVMERVFEEGHENWMDATPSEMIREVRRMKDTTPTTALSTTTSPVISESVSEPITTESIRNTPPPITIQSEDVARIIAENERALGAPPIYDEDERAERAEHDRTIARNVPAINASIRRSERALYRPARGRGWHSTRDGHTPIAREVTRHRRAARQGHRRRRRGRLPEGYVLPPQYEVRE